MLADERLYVEGQGQGHEVEEEVSDPNYHRIKSWLDTLVHQSVESHDNKSNSQQQRKVLADTDVGLKLSMSSLVDNSMGNPPKIPPRRKTSKVENPIESDYENILKTETNNQTEYFNTSTPTNGILDSEKGNEAGSIKKDAQFGTDNLEASEKVEFEIPNKSSIRMQELVDTPTSTTKAADDNSSIDEKFAVKIKDNLSLINYKEKYPGKQIIVEKLIVNGKLQEIRKYIINNDEAENSENYIEQTNEDLQTFYPDTVFSNDISNQTLTQQTNATENTPDLASESVFNKEFKTVKKDDVQILKTDDKSNSTSYESLCYSEEDEEDNDESNLNIPKTEIITSAKLLVVMDQDVLKSLREKSVSPSIAPDHNDKSLYNGFSKVESESKSDTRDENASPTFKKSTVRVSNTSNVTIQRNIPQEKTVPQVKANENDELILDQKHISIYDDRTKSKTSVNRITEQTNPTRELDLVEINETEETKVSAPRPFLEQQEETVQNFMEVQHISIPIMRATSISPSATEIIAGSTQSSRDGSPDLEQFDEFREEFEDVSSENDSEDENEKILIETNLSLSDQFLTAEHYEETLSDFPSVSNENENENLESDKGMGHKGVQLNSSKEIENIPEVISNEGLDLVNNENTRIDKKFIPEILVSNENSSKLKVVIANSLNNEFPTIVVNEVDDKTRSEQKTESDTLMTFDETPKLPDTTQVSSVENPKINQSQSPNRSPNSLNVSENTSSEENISSSRELSPISLTVFDQEENQSNETGTLEYSPDITNKTNSEGESQNNLLKTNSNSNTSEKLSRSSDREKTDSQQSDSTHISTPASMPEYVINEALNSVSIEDDKRSSLGSKSTRGSSDKSQASDRSLSMIESRAEILELLKESLSSDHVLDRIVSTLFASVLNHNDSGATGQPSDSEELPPDIDIHNFQTFSSSDSEIKTESDFYEAQEDVENEEVRREFNVTIGDEKEAEESDEYLNKELIVIKEQENDNLSTEELKVTEYEVS